MVFNIGNQQAGQINMAGRDQYNSGGQHGAVISVADAHAAVQAVWASLQNANLPPTVRDQLQQDVAAVERNLASAAPDRAQVAGRLERLTKTLGRYGALTAAGASLVTPLTTLGRWLGPAGAALLGLLP
jgi:uncharacterized membrane protein